MIERKSGYDPTTPICWRFHNKGDKHWRHKCPTCSAPYNDRSLIIFGRCRSGQRRFWKASNFTLTSKNIYQNPDSYREVQEHGFTDTEDAAWASACEAVIRLAGGRPATAAVLHGTASDGLKELNAAKRHARPAPDTSDARVTEYLYGWTIGGEDLSSSMVRFRITKKTTKRIYYARHAEYLDEHGEPRQYIQGNDYGIGYVNRQKLEADGSVRNRGVHWSSSDSHLYPSLEALLGDRCSHQDDEPDLQQLKAEMAAAHPER